jgi:hypothetical protein
MGYLAQERGDLRTARDLFSQTLYLARGLDNPLHTLMALAAAGGLLCEQGALKEAATLFAAVESLGGDEVMKNLVLDKSRYAKQFAKLKDNYDATELDTAWSQGAIVSIDQAVQLAQSSLSRWC